ncbi:MAG: hypothetical protein Q7U05_05665 [Polaromonas sp.]|nr:hypothetical protein [Polaromonas sp.]
MTSAAMPFENLAIQFRLRRQIDRSHTFIAQGMARWQPLSEEST